MSRVQQFLLDNNRQNFCGHNADNGEVRKVQACIGNIQPVHDSVTAAQGHFNEVPE